MGIFNRFKRKNEPSPILDDEISAKKTAAARRAAETRRLTQEMREMEHKIEMAELELQLRQKQQELEEYNDDDDELQDMAMQGGKPEDILLMGLMQQMNKGQNAAAQPPQTPIQEEQPVVLSDDGIRQILQQAPQKYVKMAKLMPEQDVRSLIKAQVPLNLSEDTITRAIEIIKNS